MSLRKGLKIMAKKQERDTLVLDGEKPVKTQAQKKEKDSKSKANKKAKKLILKSMQDVLDFEQIHEDGIIESKGYYSKLYNLVDSNFVTEPEDKQVDYLRNYTKLINRFPENVDISIIIVNKRNTMEDLTKSYHIEPQGDKYDCFRDAYNEIIDEKIKEGRNDIAKEKYIMLTAKEADFTAAQTTFSSADIALNDAVKTINKVGVKPVDALTRLELTHSILNGTGFIPFRKEYAKYISVKTDENDNETEYLDKTKMMKDGFGVKDLLVPQTIAKGKQCIQLSDNRYAKSYAYINLPSSLDTSFLTKTTNLPYEMVTVIQLAAVPRKKAMNMIKMQNTSIKADVIKASKQAYQGGYSPDLIDEDLQKAQMEARKLRNDVVAEGKRIFFATMTVTIFGENAEDLININNQFKSICADFTVTPQYLIGEQDKGLNSACLFGKVKLVLDRMLTSDNVCALFPFNIQELQDRHGHFYGINAISKNMIMYDRKRSRLANGLVFGQSGSGKSFITKGEVIPNLLDGNDDMIILDPENEYRVIAEAYGGTVIDLELKSDYHINPCDMNMEWNDPKATPLAEKCDYMVSLVEAILGRGRECNSFEVNAIHKATKTMYDSYIDEMTRRKNDGIVQDIDTSICPTLVDFYNCLAQQATPEAAKIANAIEPYCTGQYNIFAHRTNIPTDKRLTVFNLLSLPEKMKEMAMKVCLANIWTRIVKNRENNEKMGTNKAIWVYLDEFHLFFQTERSADTIMAYFKRVRKYGGIMTGITQDVADLLRSQQGTAMFNNTGFFIFLNQSPIGRAQLQQLYQISDNLIDYIKDRPSGQGLIYNNSILIPFDYRLPTDNELYKQMSTNPNDKKYISSKAKEEETKKRQQEAATA